MRSAATHCRLSDGRLLTPRELAAHMLNATGRFFLLTYEPLEIGQVAPVLFQGQGDTLGQARVVRQATAREYRDWIVASDPDDHATAAIADQRMRTTADRGEFFYEVAID